MRCWKRGEPRRPARTGDAEYASAYFSLQSRASEEGGGLPDIVDRVLEFVQLGRRADAIKLAELLQRFGLVAVRELVGRLDKTLGAEPNRESPAAEHGRAQNRIRPDAT